MVIGGGDTGMDCLSSANREVAQSVVLLDVYGALPPSGRYPGAPWPQAPRRTRTTYALDEGGERRFGIQVTAIEGSEDGHVTAVHGRPTATSPRSRPEPGRAAVKRRPRDADPDR